jgi:hypothetical protein
MNLKNAIILFLITLLLCVAFYYIKENIIKTNTKVITKDYFYYQTVIDSLNTQIDSLNNLNFNYQTIISKYEMTLEILKQEDYKTANKFQLILNNKTE